MAEEPFPWNRPMATEPPPAAPEKSARPMSKFLQKPLQKPWLRATLPFAAFALLLVFIYFSRNHAVPDAGAATPGADIDAFVVMMPIPKGGEVHAEILKQIPLMRSELTKAQMLQLIRPEDLEHLRGRIRAKKNIPPNKPLLWSDIEFHATSAGPPVVPATAIVFSKEN